MMVDFKLDPLTNDMVLDGRGQAVMVDGIELVAQRLRVRFNTHRGEWPLDITAGVPWRDVVFTRPFNQSVSSAVMRSLILDTPGVISLLSFSLTQDPISRLLAVNFEALAEGGVITAAGAQSAMGAQTFSIVTSIGPGVGGKTHGILGPSVGSL